MSRSDNYSHNDELDRQIFQKILEMTAAREKPDEFASSWEAARSLLDALALDIPTYDSAVAKLNNALRYVRSNESGLANYELQVLTSELGLDGSHQKESGGGFDPSGASGCEFLDDSLAESGVC